MSWLELKSLPFEKAVWLTTIDLSINFDENTIGLNKVEFALEYTGCMLAKRESKVGFEVFRCPTIIKVKIKEIDIPTEGHLR
jgi:hypothetical protein